MPSPLGPAMIIPRAYQTSAVDECRAHVAAGRRRPLLCAPTGSGKTICSTMVITSALSLGRRVLFVAHRRELIKQPLAKLLRAGVAADALGVVMAGVPSKPRGTVPLDGSTDDELWTAYARRDPTAHVQIASIDTLRNRALSHPPDLIIIDEAHRSLAKSYRTLIDLYPSAVLFGMTATPVRSDGRGLGEVYDALVVVASYTELVAGSYLVSPRVWSVPAADLPDLSGVRTVAGDYDQGQLGDAVDKAKLIGSMVDHYALHGGGAPALAFAVNVEHSRHIAQQFNAAGIPALHVDGETPTPERDAALTALRSGAVKVLTNCDVFTEGTDLPLVKCIILARPTKSVRIYLQQVGRGSRPFGALPFVVLDHAGNAVEHGRPDRDREWTLDAKPKKKGGAPPAKTCPSCYAVVEPACRVCPECGHEFELTGPGEIEEVAGSLVEIHAVTIEQQRAFWERLVAERGGRKPGWVWFKFQDQFRTKPPREWKVPLTDSDRAARESEQAETWRRYSAEADAKGHKPSAAAMRFRARFGRFPTAGQKAEWRQ